MKGLPEVNPGCDRQLSEEQLTELYAVIKEFRQSKQNARQQSIQLDGPEDLAVNNNLYFSEEKLEEKA